MDMILVDECKIISIAYNLYGCFPFKYLLVIINKAKLNSNKDPTKLKIPVAQFISKYSECSRCKS